VPPEDAATRGRLDRSDALVLAAAAGAAVLLVWLGLGLTFFADEWSVIADRSVSVDGLLQPFNEHWLAVAIVVYHAMLSVFGMHSYVPYLALLAAMHVTVALLVYTLVRRRTLRPVAVGVALIVLLFGSGFENLFWGIQIDFVGATALGFGALVLLDDLPTLPGARRAALATALLTVGVMTSGYGLFMLGLVGLDLLLDGRRRRWILPLLAPTALYGAWYLAFGRAGLATHGNPLALDRALGLPVFVFEGASSAFGSAVGGGELLGHVVVVGVLVWCAALAARGRAIPSRAVACLLAITAEYLITGLVRDQLGLYAATYTRYAYLSGMLALIALASLVGRPAIPPRLVPRAAAVGLAVLALSLIWNVQLLVGGRDLFGQRADMTRALVTAGLRRPLPAETDPTRTLVLVPSPADLERITAQYGDVRTDSLVPGAVRPIPPDVQAEADRRVRYGAPVPTAAGD
jgi:hypothetical protein